MLCCGCIVVLVSGSFRSIGMLSFSVLYWFGLLAVYVVVVHHLGCVTGWLGILFQVVIFPRSVIYCIATSLAVLCIVSVTRCRICQRRQYRLQRVGRDTYCTPSPPHPRMTRGLSGNVRTALFVVPTYKLNPQVCQPLIAH